MTIHVDTANSAEGKARGGSVFDGRSVIVGTRTGGQGKTLISQVIAYASVSAGVPPKIVSVDSTESGGTSSKLARFLGNVEEIAFAAKMSDVARGGARVVAHWDRLGGLLMDGGCLIDLGANVLPVIFEWAKESAAGSMMKPITLVIPVTCQGQSAGEAVEIVRESLEWERDFPVTKRIVLFNDAHGDVKDARGGAFDELAKFERNGVIVTGRFEKCFTEVWTWVESEGISLVELAKMETSDYVARFGLNPFASNRSRNAIMSWLEAQVGMLEKVGLAPRALGAVSEVKGDGTF